MSATSITNRTKTMWTNGDYAKFAKYMEPGALQILASWHISSGSRLLDIACGAGQISIPAARAGVEVTGVDIASNLIAQARERAAAEGLSAQFDEGDAEQLLYPDASFDTVVSLIGAMFAPHPDRVAAEMVRVCRPGGRILMANWTPTGLVSDTFKLFAKYSPPPPGIPSPFLWGHQATVRERFSRGIANLEMMPSTYVFAFPFSVTEFVEFSRQNNPVWNRAFQVLEESAQKELRRETEALHARYNRATDGTVAFEEDCLQVTAWRS